jgi:uncharacterized protein
MSRERGLRVVVDGTNADDLGEYRPGAPAASEMGVESPLALVGLTKLEIRALSRERGPVHLVAAIGAVPASRIPYGTEVTRARLAQVERAESSLVRSVSKGTSA